MRTEPSPPHGCRRGRATGPVRVAANAISMLILAGAMSGCGATGIERVRDMVDGRIDYDVVQHQSDLVDADTRARVRAMLAEPLTAETAVQIGLLNNRALQASLAELDVLNATIGLPNPELHAEFRIGSGLAAVEVGASYNLSALVHADMRRFVADAEQEARRVDGALAVIRFAFDCERAFYDYVAATQHVELAATVLEASGASYEAAQRLHAAGNITDLNLTSERVSYEEARLALAEARSSEVDARERLNVLLGVFADETEWTIEGRLPAPPDSPFEIDEIERRALDQSLDLTASRHRMTATAREQGVERTERWHPHIEWGVHAEREPGEGPWSVGPSVDGELPLFGNNASERSAAALTRQRHHYADLAVRVRAAARRSQARVELADARARYYLHVILPLRQRIVDETQLHYNAMQVGVFELLEAKRQQIDAGRRYIDSLRQYWVARSDLEQVLAGSLPDGADRASGEARGGSMPDRASPEGGH